LATAAAHGQTPANWLGPTSGNWTNPARWSTNPAFPNNGGPTYNVTISASGSPYVVTLDQNITIVNMTMNSPDLTLLHGGAFTLRTTQNLSIGGGAVIDGGGFAATVQVDGTTTLQNTSLRRIPIFRSLGPIIYSNPGTITIDDSQVDHADGSAVMTGGGDMVITNGGSINNGAGCDWRMQDNRQIRWDSNGAQPTITNLGTLVRDVSAGTTELLDVTFVNSGTLETRTGTFRTNGLAVNTVGNRLTGGTYRVLDGSLDLVGQTVLINEATVELGVGAGTFAAFNALQTNAATGTFTVDGARTFTTAGSFGNTGTLNVRAGATVEVPGGSLLQNVVGNELTGGVFNIAGTLRAPNLDSVNSVSSRVVLDGPTSRLVNPLDVDALASLATIASGGELGVINGRTFTTTGDLTLGGTGRLTVGAGSQFTVNGTITNLAAGTFSSGQLAVAGTLRFNDADINTIAGDLTLDDAGASIVDQNNLDAFRNLSAVAGAGRLALSNGRNLAVSGPLSNAGNLTVGVQGNTTPTSLTVSGALTQTAGVTSLSAGSITAPGGFLLQGGALQGNGTINGDMVVDGVIRPGFSPGLLMVTGDVQQSTNAMMEFELGGYARGVVGGYDGVDITGDLTFDAGSAGTLQIALLGGFVPAYGDTFQLINAGTVTGQFASVTGGAIPGGLRFEVVYAPGGISLVVVPAPAAALLILGLCGSRRRRL